MQIDSMVSASSRRGKRSSSPEWTDQADLGHPLLPAVPLTTYIMVGAHQLPERVQQKVDATGGEVCTNVFFVGQSRQRSLQSNFRARAHLPFSFGETLVTDRYTSTTSTHHHFLGIDVSARFFFSARLPFSPLPFSLHGRYPPYLSGVDFGGGPLAHPLPHHESMLDRFDVSDSRDEVAEADAEVERAGGGGEVSSRLRLWRACHGPSRAPPRLGTLAAECVRTGRRGDFVTLRLQARCDAG